MQSALLILLLTPWGSRPDGSMIDPEQIPGGNTGSDARISGPALICIYVGGAVVGVALSVIVYRLLAFPPLSSQTPTLLQPYMPLHIIRNSDGVSLSHDRALLMFCNSDSCGFPMSC